MAQRVSLVGISVAAALGLAWTALETRAPDVRHVSAAIADAEAGTGSRAPAGAEEDDLLDNWLFEGNDFFSGPLLHGERLAEVKRRRVQKTIAWMARIQDARLEIDKPTQSFIGTRGPDGSATVALFLMPGVERLSPREARVVRQIVHGAYGLRPDVVSLTDNMGNSYPAEDDDRPDSYEEDDRYLANLDKDITELISGLFDAHEFQLVVRGLPRSASVSGRRAPSEVGGLMVAGSRQRVYLSSLCAPDAPGGSHGEQGVNVVATFDLDAVRRLVADDSLESGAGFHTIDEFKAGQKQVIESLLVPHPGRVSVFVQPLAKREPLLAAVPGDGSRPTMQRGGEGSPRKWAVWRDWIESNWPFLAMVGAALLVVLVGGAATWRGWARSSRESSRLRGGGAAGVVPPRRAARSNAGANAQTAWRLFPGRSVASGGVLSGTNGQDSLLSATDRMSEWVEERPRTAASVLRVWLAQPAPVPDVSREGGPP